MPNYTVLEIKRSDNLTRIRNGVRCIWILENKDMVDDTLASYVWAHWPEQLAPRPPRHEITASHVDAYFDEMDGIEYIFIHPPEPLLLSLKTRVIREADVIIATFSIFLLFGASVSAQLDGDTKRLWTALIGMAALGVRALTRWYENTRGKEKST